MALHRRLLRSVLAIATLAAAIPAAQAQALSLSPYVCRDDEDGVRPLRLGVDGETAFGRYAVPRGRPTGLVIFAHGFGHTSLSWAGHMRSAARHGLIAAAMDYRGLQITPDDDGDGLPQSRGWPAIAGAEDSIAAARTLQAHCGIRTVTIMGVSMGGNMSGLALAIAGERGITRGDGVTPLFDYWIDVEGAVNMTETYAAARLAGPANETAAHAKVDIEAETGGSLEQYPDEYRRRTVVARVGDIQSSGVQGVIAIHGLDDGLVPYNQSRELVAEAREAGLPTEMITIGRRDEDSEQETTLTGHAAGAVYPDYISPLSGHASEKSTTHIVMQTALNRLWRLMAGSPPVEGECLVNGQVPEGAGRLCSPS